MSNLFGVPVLVHRSSAAAKPGDSMSKIPGLKKELSHTNSITGLPSLPKFGIGITQDKEDEISEVKEGEKEN